MTYQERKKLYEDIIDEISKVVKKTLNEYLPSNKEDVIEAIDDNMFSSQKERLEHALDNIYKRAEATIKNLSKEQINNMCTDILGHAHMVNAIIPKTRVDEMFRNTEEFQESFIDFKQRLEGVCNLGDWQVEIADVFNNGNALAFMKQLMPADASSQYIISVIVPDINQNIPFLKEFMEENGYYLLRCFQGEDYISMNNKQLGLTKMSVICFAQKRPVNLMKLVKQYPYLYHVTDSRNMDLIKKYGLVARSRNSEYDITNEDIHYPARTYFFVDSNDEKAVSYARRNMLPGNYHLLRINTSDLQNDDAVYSDPLIGRNAVYIETDISPKLISDVKTFLIR